MNVHINTHTKATSTNPAKQTKKSINHEITIDFQQQ